MKNTFKLELLAAAALMASSVAHAAPTVKANWGIHDDPAEHASCLVPQLNGLD